MSNMIVEVIENEQAKLTIEYDQVAESPREAYDNLGTMVCWHRNYNLGDKHSYSEARDFFVDLAIKLGASEDNDLVHNWSNEQLANFIDKHVIIRKVYMYEHSMVALSTQSFLGRAHHADWDSGPVGYIYITKAKAREEYSAKRISPKLRKKIECYMNNEVETYGEYVNGSVFGFTLEKKIPVGDPEDGEFELEEIDACWGFYGWDFKKNGLAEHIPPEYAELVAQL